MRKTLSLAGLAAVIAGIGTLLPALAPDVAAETPSAAPAQTAPSCALQGWPYYDPSCLRSPSGNVRPVRIIAIDRVQAGR